MKINRYTVGSTLSLISPNLFIMVDERNSDLVDDLWNITLADTWALADVIDRIARNGLSALPDFALVANRGTNTTVLVRGSYSVEVESDSGVEHALGEAVATWRELTFDAASVHSVSLAPQGGSVETGISLPIVSGVVLASQVEAGPFESASAQATAAVDEGAEKGESSTSESDPLAVPAAKIGVGDAETAAEEVLPADEVLSSDEGAVSEPTESAEPAASESAEPDATPAAVEVGDESDRGDEPSEEAEDSDGTSDSSLASDSGNIPDPNETLFEHDPSSKFDAMFGRTIAGRRLEDAAVREPEASATPLVEDPANVTRTSDGGGDHAGDTMSAAALAKLRAERQTVGSVPSDKQDSRPRTQATVRLSTGKVVELDRPLVLGRSPRAHGNTSADLPQLVVIDNPFVSGTHLMVAIEDDVVLVTDMSTNGTLITLPGSDPVRLDKGRPSAVTDGCVLTLADDITLTISITRGEG